MSFVIPDFDCIDKMQYSLTLVGAVGETRTHNLLITGQLHYHCATTAHMPSSFRGVILFANEVDVDEARTRDTKLPAPALTN